MKVAVRKQANKTMNAQMIKTQLNLNDRDLTGIRELQKGCMVLDGEWCKAR